MIIKRGNVTLQIDDHVIVITVLGITEEKHAVINKKLFEQLIDDYQKTTDGKK